MINSSIAWLDGILGIFIFGGGLCVLSFIFRHDHKKVTTKS